MGRTHSSVASSFDNKGFAISLDKHCQNVLMAYSHANLNVHNLDSIQAFHIAKKSTARRLCARLYQTMLSLATGLCRTEGSQEP